MGLDLVKLESVKRRGNSITARCPACFEKGHDRKGNHLYISGDGRFGCVLNPGIGGHEHRQRIFELVGVQEHKNTLKVKLHPIQFKEMSPPELIESNILGRLGRMKQTHKEIQNQDSESPESCNFRKNFEKSVPNVPCGDFGNYAQHELSLIQSLDQDSLRIVNKIKNMFLRNKTSIKNRAKMNPSQLPREYVNKRQIINKPIKLYNNNLYTILSLLSNDVPIFIERITSK